MKEVYYPIIKGAGTQIDTELANDYKKYSLLG